MNDPATRSRHGAAARDTLSAFLRQPPVQPGVFAPKRVCFVSSTHTVLRNRVEWAVLGRTNAGLSMAVRVTQSCYPFFYVRAPRGWSALHCALFAEWLDNEVRERLDKEDMVVDVSLVPAFAFGGFEPPWAESHMLRVRVVVPRAIRALTDDGGVLRCARRLRQRWAPHEAEALGQLFQCDVPYELMATAQWTGYRPGQWFDVVGHTVTADRVFPGVDLELRVDSHTELVLVPECRDPMPLRIASLDIEVLTDATGVFPHPDAAEFPVLCVSLAWCTEGAGGAPPTESNCLTIMVGEVEEGKQGCMGRVLCVPSERHLLETLADVLRTGQYDIVTGWNSNDFDMQTLVNRAAKLDVPFRCGARNDAVRVHRSTFSSNQGGTRVNTRILCDGVFFVDAMQWAQKSVKLDSYGLGAVASVTVGKTKVDMPYDRIPVYAQTPVGRMQVAIYCAMDAFLPLRILAFYKTVPQLSALSMLQGTHIDTLVTRGQRASGMAMYLYFLHAHASVAGNRMYVLPFKPFVKAKGDGDGDNGDGDGGDGGDGDAPGAGEEEGKYKGAYVFPPRAGWYQHPVITLDFASLYPSLMDEFDCCPSTIVKGGWSVARGLADELRARGHEFRMHRIVDLDDDNRAVETPEDTTFLFVQGGDAAKPITPLILQHQRALRKEYKAVMKAVLQETGSEDDLRYKTADAAQASVKVCMNSVYGLLGSGIFPGSRAIGMAVTTSGRRAILRVQDYVHSHVRDYVPGSEWARAYAASHALDPATTGVGNMGVVYGDTDSVFVLLEPPAGAPGVSETMAAAVGKDMCKRITQEQYRGKNPGSVMALEYEKALLNCLLLVKKRYAGLRVEEGGIRKLLIKGMARRDLFGYAAALQADILHILVSDSGYERGANVEPRMWRNHADRLRAVAALVAKRLTDLREGRVYLDELRSSRNLSRPPQIGAKNGYSATSPPPHVAFVRRLMANDPNEVFAPGTRVSFIVGAVSRVPRSTKLGDRYMRPIEAVGQAIDKQHYTDLIANMVLRIMTVATGSEAAARSLCLPARLVQMPRVAHVPDTRPTRGLMAFVRVTETRCLWCRAVLTQGASGVCPGCSSSRARLLRETRRELDAHAAARAQHEARCGGCVNGDGAEPLRDIEDGGTWQCDSQDCATRLRRLQDSKRYNETLSKLRLLEV